jgi:glycerate kinase
MGKDYQLVFEQGIDAVLTIAPGPITLEESMKEAEKLVINAAENAMRLFMCGVRSKK